MFKSKTSNISGAKILSKEIIMFKGLPHKEPVDFTIVLNSENEKSKVFYPHSVTNKHYDLETYIGKLLLNDFPDETLILDYYSKYSENEKLKLYSVKMIIKNNIVKIEDIIKYIYFDKLHNTYIDYDEDNEIKNKYMHSEYIY